MSEQYGCDVLLHISSTDADGKLQMRKVGIQRKKFPDDLIASLADGRLAKQIQMMKGLDVAILLLEGKGWWVGDKLQAKFAGRTFTRRELRALIFSIQIEHGLRYMQTEGLRETCDLVMDLRTWLMKKNHDGLVSRPKAGAWGPDSTEWKMWFWQAIPGVGPVVSRRLAEAWPRLPIKLMVSRAEVEKVAGPRAKEVVKYLG